MSEIREKLRWAGWRLGIVANAHNKPALRGREAANLAADCVEACEHIKYLEDKVERLKNELSEAKRKITDLECPNHTTEATQ